MNSNQAPGCLQVILYIIIFLIICFAIQPLMTTCRPENYGLEKPVDLFLR